MQFTIGCKQCVCVWLIHVALANIEWSHSLWLVQPFSNLLWARHETCHEINDVQYLAWLLRLQSQYDKPCFIMNKNEWTPLILSIYIPVLLQLTECNTFPFVFCHSPWQSLTEHYTEHCQRTMESEIKLSLQSYHGFIFLRIKQW